MSNHNYDLKLCIKILPFFNLRASHAEILMSDISIISIIIIEFAYLEL